MVYTWKQSYMFFRLCKYTPVQQVLAQRSDHVVYILRWCDELALKKTHSMLHRGTFHSQNLFTGTCNDIILCIVSSHPTLDKTSTLRLCTYIFIQTTGKKCQFNVIIFLLFCTYNECVYTRNVLSATNIDLVLNFWFFVLFNYVNVTKK